MLKKKQRQRKNFIYFSTDWLFLHHRKSVNSEWLIIIAYIFAESVRGNLIRYTQSSGSLSYPISFCLFHSFRTISTLLLCSILHFTKNPIYLTTPNPSTNCRKSAAHPYSSRKPHNSHRDRIKQLQVRVIYDSTYILQDRYRHMRRTPFPL